jgi:hypothetical protein
MVAAVGGHRLFRYERWLAALVERRQVEHHTASVVRIEEKFGPDGVVLMAAGMCTMVPGEILALIGFVLLITAGSGSALVSTSYWLIAAGIAVIAIGAVRLFQAVPVGRAFREDRLPS